MEFIKLNCPNCNGKIEYKEGRTFKCPYCETELLLKENKVYFVDQTINNYYGTPPAQTTTQPKANVKWLFIVSLVLMCSMVGYLLLTNNRSEESNDVKSSVRTVPESEVLLFFLKDIFNKGAAMPTDEEIASIRYLSTRLYEDQWHFAYSFDDPFTNEQAQMSDYVITDKILNTQRIEQKDLEAFSGLTVLNLMEEYEVSQSEKVSFRHMQGLKSYGGGFNESFSRFAHYFGDKAKIVELSTQIRSNAEMAVLLEFPNLQSLEITYVDESVTDFYLLNQLSLKSLSLQFVNDLKWLSSLTSLESLTVKHSDATDFSALYSLSQMQELKLSAVKNLKTLDFIQNMPNLQSVDLELPNITNLERLRNKLSLTKLHLSSLGQLGSIEVVNSLTSLTELSITSYYGSVSSFTLPNLKKAELSNSFIVKLKAPALKSLTVYTQSEDLNGAEFAKYPQLEQLSVIGGTGFRDIRSLNRLPSLQTIDLNETFVYDEAGALFDLQHVKTLNCYACKFELDSQDPPSNNTLEHLTLDQASFRIGNEYLKEMDQVMPYFANLTALRSFTLQDSSIQSLNFMKNWQQIEVLHLENNAISNVEPLVNLPNLQKLYILGNQVQNKSVLDKGILIY
ncbi:leucine-rich repeat domain-containing protein [Paenibacillus eucommiae]|uniref:DNA-directed RNA polymerase subunit RPC12/RpoP n=1 Tax=Paenibacillus eucommiae TaxID=1355755 RepID=A0ABS4J0C6_9BACL|nr:leucine-rich repeat domain-containing protein [Paenibacillus eucommiae]MBP1993255.1 DNA-directed RNA polymerase subunit RPC12/RpoP [Paenibacillus eucommiae]